MNNRIERVNRMVGDFNKAGARTRTRTRKPRRDSILGGLAAGQRAMVDKWLFDKGMTYQEVAEACGKMFGVRVSKSSVGRYFQAMSVVQSPKSKVGEEAAGMDESTFDGMSGAELYERMLAKVMEQAWVEANLPEELREVKFLCQLMRILIAARRERNDAEMAAIERARFEVGAARKVLKHLRYSIYDLRAPNGRPRGGSHALDRGEMGMGMQ